MIPIPPTIDCIDRESLLSGSRDQCDCRLIRCCNINRHFWVRFSVPQRIDTCYFMDMTAVAATTTATDSAVTLYTQLSGTVVTPNVYFTIFGQRYGMFQSGRNFHTCHMFQIIHTAWYTPCIHNIIIIIVIGPNHGSCSIITDTQLPESIRPKSVHISLLCNT